MAGKSVVLVFLLEGGHQHNVTMHEETARRLLTDWLSGKTALDKTTRVGDVHCPGPWAVRMDSIVSMAIYPAEVTQHQQGQQRIVSPAHSQPHQGMPRLSGY